MKQAVVASAVLVLLNCTYVPIPRPTHIHPGVELETGAGVAVLHSRWRGTEPAGQGSVRLGLNPSDWLGFDLGVHGGWYGFTIGELPIAASLGARIRPIPKVNTTLFGEATLGCLHAGIAQGIPVTGREAVTLALTYGKWPSARNTGILNYDWFPLVLGSVSWHGRTSRLRISPSLVGGCYCGADWEPGTWLLGITVSGARRAEDESEDDGQTPWQPTLKFSPRQLARVRH